MVFRRAWRRGSGGLAVGWLILGGVLTVWSQNPLIVTFLDCGQGDAAVVQTPAGKTILIDAGPVELQEGFDAGRDVVIPFLLENGVTRIDIAVFSHPHLDHIGGFKHILANFLVGQVYDPGFPYPSPDYKEVLGLIQEKKIKYAVLRAGEILKWDPSLKVEALNPPVNLPWDDPNENSLVLRIEHGQVSFLFTGDAEEEAEYEMVIRYGPALASTVLKVGHHGSNTSTKPEFLTYVRPETAVISCGRFNRFRHPHRKVLKRLEEHDVPVFRTDTQGTIRVISDGKKYKVEPKGFQ